ncbi:MAG: UDP-N-acetylglucosamine--N-acetylmuramyl-(pentapeptide) pyrophosphoryl-undecaprenol N-acetylglucosamine transferase, partial [Oscillospiraceae bacterium]|nr:UDP-N-acetylglucosamine--N-acetylmuramyl-(pentapeptide) pyrophosphoryl-undecaprenol N-acetylglucosamine transferase [Oscillospiraceae bacterium]
MNFLIACGGTAGHINPALAVAQELKGRIPQCRVLFVGAGKELEKRLIPASGFHLVNIKMSGLRRSISPRNLLYNAKTVRNLTTAGIKAENLIKRFAPDAVIGTGGYICYPVLKKAASLKIPTVIHGSDAVAGLTTKMVSGVVDRVLVSFPGLEKDYRVPEKVVFTGTPIRAGFNIEAEQAAKAASGAGTPLVVSFWGSLGAERMNTAMAQVVKLNTENRQFAHIHATGKNSLESMQGKLKRLGVDALSPDISIREYINDMQAVMAEADLVVCRAGASTIAELTAMGKPAILVPSPYVTNNHQQANAQQLEKIGGAVVILEKDCTGGKLYEEITKLLKDKDRL